MIAVTGGTGFVGRVIVRKLLEAGQDVRLLVRPSSRRDILAGKAVQYAEGDVTDPASLGELTRGAAAVVHLVGVIEEKHGATFETIHVEGTRSVVAAAQKAGVKKFVHMSAMGARADAPSRYHRTKWAAEEIVRGSGIPYVIFRPSIICGRDDEFVNKLAGMIRFPGAITHLMPVIGSGRSKLQPVSLEDVAFCFVKAATDETLLNKTYDVAGPEAMTVDEMLDRIMRVMGRFRLKVHVPVGLVSPLVRLMELAHLPSPVTSEQLLMLREDNVGDIGPMKKDFDLEPARFEDVIGTYLS